MVMCLLLTKKENKKIFWGDQVPSTMDPNVYLAIILFANKHHPPSLRLPSVLSFFLFFFV